MNIRKIIEFAIGPIGSAILGLISLPIVAWFFDPNDIGRLSMMQITISFSLLFFTLGLDQAYVREYYETTNKPNLLKSAFLPGFLLLTIFITIITLLPWSISYILFGIDSKQLTLLLIIAIVLQFISLFLSLILRMEEKGLAYSMSLLLPKLIFLLVILSYLCLNFDSTFENLMIANLLSIIVVFLVYGFNTRHEWIPALTSSIDFNKQKRMLSFGLPLIGSGIAFWGLTAMDKLFIRGYSTFKELGLYSVSFSFASIALILQAIFSTIWAPIVYKWNVEGISPQKVKTVINCAVFAVVLLWCLMGMLSWIIAFILPSKYNQVQYIMLAAISYPLLYTLSEATSLGINITRRTYFSVLATSLALIINGIGNWFLVPDYGATGAAISSAIAFFVFFLLKTEISNRIWLSFPRANIYILLFLLVLLSISINIESLRLYSRICFSLIFLYILLFKSKFIIDTFRGLWLSNNAN